MILGYIFFLYEEVKDKFVAMENSSNACVMGVGEVVLKFILGSTITLMHVRMEPCRKSFKKERCKMVFESNNVFINKGYLSESHFHFSTWGVLILSQIIRM